MKARIPVVAAAVIIAAIIIFWSVILHLELQSRDNSSLRNGIINQLYSDPSNQWQQILKVHQEYGNIAMYVVINPDNGSGNEFDGTYASYINSLASAGITVAGYVHTSYGNRSMGSVVEDISNYTNWYDLHSIFLDEVSDSPSLETYYEEIANFTAHSGITYLIGNPGDFVPYRYLSLFNLTIIYENPGYPDVKAISSYSGNVSRSQVGIISYSVPWGPTYVTSIENSVSVQYISNWNLPDPYQNVSAYLGNLAQVLST